MVMLSLTSPGFSEQVGFLERYPTISRWLFAEANLNPSQAATVIESILAAPDRAQGLDYIQAIATGRTAFLATSLSGTRDIYFTKASAGWSIGRSNHCAITMVHPSVSRCHVAIGHHLRRGFYIVDLASKNGTLVNQQRLPKLKQQALQDGDLIEISRIEINFFVSKLELGVLPIADTQPLDVTAAHLSSNKSHPLQVSS